MEVVLLLISTIILISLLKQRLKQIKKTNTLTIFDGLFFGGLFFTFLPLFYSFIIGKISILDILIFNPYIDTDLLLYILSANIVFGISANLIKFKNRLIEKDFIISKFEQDFFIGVLVFYVLSLTIIFLSSGKLNGGSHWYRANADVFARGPLYVLLGQFHNVGRVFLPGICLYFQLVYLKKGLVFKPHFYVAGILIIMELIMSGNRIVILFFVFSIAIPFLLYGYYKKMLIMILFCLPLITVAKFWPMVRGMIWAEEVSMSRFSEVISIAYENEIESEDSSDPILVITEGSNIAALKYVTDNYPSNKDFTFGDTMIFKAIGALIPKSIWKDKPGGVGHEAGESVASGVSLYLNVTLLGDAWANFGWFGILYIVFLLFILQNLISFFCSNYIKYVSALAFMVAVASWRFEFSFYFISLYTMLIFIFIFKIKILTYIFKSLKRNFF
ncbi:O-antigen polymerase [Polaribacter sargassicola]|uniref:O-antigen polymerase n=1 Tax=Polaribacter sargassicola TaxID=2836891 RepID=UPI001F4520D4|nr:O-antigen polymerase [Polaribacter sp. DS7-9]MCG1037474.1 oligosaccharide repeat unit polymerase [Polaribacter sp. DS7-9]